MLRRGQGQAVQRLSASTRFPRVALSFVQSPLDPNAGSELEDEGLGCTCIVYGSYRGADRRMLPKP